MMGVHRSAPRSAPVALWELLQTSAELPHGTKHIRVDARLAVVIGRYLGLPADFVLDVFAGSPVREAHGIVEWVEGEPEPFERLRMLEAWAYKKGRAVNPEAHRAAVEGIIPGRPNARMGVAS
jgi:hypothetical protein